MIRGLILQSKTILGYILYIRNQMISSILHSSSGNWLITNYMTEDPYLSNNTIGWERGNLRSLVLWREGILRWENKIFLSQTRLEFTEGRTSSSNNTREDSTRGRHQKVDTEIKLIIVFAAKDGAALYSQQKQDQELTVAQIMTSLVPNSDWNWRKWEKTTRPYRWPKSNPLQCKWEIDLRD